MQFTAEQLEDRRLLSGATIDATLALHPTVLTNLDSRLPTATEATSGQTASVATPENLAVTAASDTHIDLQWEWSGVSSGVTYTVQRAPGVVLGDASLHWVGPGDYQTIAAGLTDTRFSDTSMTPGGGYYYQVIAVAQGHESAPSCSVVADAIGQLNITSAIIDSHIAVGQTATLRLTYDVPPAGGHPSSLSIGWGDDAISDLDDPTTAADIRVALSPDGKQATITATHQYTADGTCTASVDISDGARRAMTTLQDLTVVVGTGLGAPEHLSALTVGTRVYVDWDCHCASTGVTYTVQRAALAWTAGWPSSSYLDGATYETIATGLDATTYTDTALTPGLYAYRVVAESHGHRSAPSHASDDSWVDRLGELNITSAAIDGHVGIGQTVTLRCAYDVPPAGGHPSISLDWGDDATTDTAIAGTLQATFSSDARQILVTATHRYTAGGTYHPCIAICDGLKEAYNTDMLAVVGTGQSDVAAEGAYCAPVTLTADGTLWAYDNSGHLSPTDGDQVTPGAASSGAPANSPFATTPAVFDMASPHGLFDLAQTPAAAPAAPEQPFGTVIIPATETRTEKAQQDNLDFLDASAPAQPSPADTQTATAQPAASEQPTAPAPAQAAPTPVIAPAPAAPAGQQSQAQPTAPIPAGSRGAVQAPAQTPRSASLAPAAVALLLAQRLHRPSAETKKRARR